MLLFFALNRNEQHIDNHFVVDVFYREKRIELKI